MLRHARQEAELAQRDIGESLGYTEDVVSNMEALRMPISCPDALLWARRSHLEDEELFEAALHELRKRKVKKR